MRCFGNGKPNLSASQNTRNKGNSMIYTHMKNLYKEEKCQNANASLILDRGGYLRKANSFASRRRALYGHALCAPCDLSRCACVVAVSNAFLDTLSEETGAPRAHLHLLGIGPTTMKLAWNVFQKPDAWNATDTSIDASGVTYTTLCCASGCCWAYDGKTNMLDNNTLDCCCDADAPCLEGAGVVIVACVKVGCNTGAAVDCCADCEGCGTCEGCHGGAGVIIVGCLRINCGTPPLGESWPDPCAGGNGVLVVGCLETTCDSVATARVSKATAAISTLGGDNVCITPSENLFGSTCEIVPMPTGTFAFKGVDLMSSWAWANPTNYQYLLSSICSSLGPAAAAAFAAKYGPKRPPTTIQNYLSNLSGLTFGMGRLRFY